MTDRYTRALLTIIAVALIGLILQRQFASYTPVQAQAGKTPQHCLCVASHEIRNSF